MMEDSEAWVMSKVEVGFGEKSSPQAGHPAISMIGLQLPASSGQQEKLNISRNIFPLSLSREL
jgi:hypothetical protein